MTSLFETTMERNAPPAEISSDNNSADMYDEDCQHIFPQRLMNILTNEKNHDAICWLPHGRAFIIRNRKLFAEKIMPRFFPRKSKYSSFTRKLNRWNFVRVSSGPEIGAYYHEFFLRDKPHLAAQMFCKNARTMIAMATENNPKPAPPAAVTIETQAPSTTNVPMVSPSQQQPQQNFQAQQMQKQPPQQQVQSLPGLSVKEADAATDLFLRNQQLDPAVQFLLNQQLNLCQQQQQQMPAQMPQQQVQQQQMPMVAPSSMQQMQSQQQQQQQQLAQVDPTPFFQPQQEQQPSLLSFQNPSPLIPEPTPILAYGDGTPMMAPSAGGMNSSNMHDAFSANNMFSNSNNGMNNTNNQNMMMAMNQNNMSNMNMNNNNDTAADLNLWQQIQAQKKQEAQMMQLRQLMALNLQKQQKRKSGAKNFRASAA